MSLQNMLQNQLTVQFKILLECVEQKEIPQEGINGVI